MNAPLFVGIDVGTTGAKAVLVDAAGAILAQAGEEYPTYYPEAYAAEQDPDDWWRALCRFLPRLFAEAGVSAERVAAISVSSQAPTVVAVDKSLAPLHRALIWMDRRAEAECEWLREHVGEARFTALSGGRIDPYYLAPKLMWFLRNRPELRQSLATVLTTNGYIAARLTGVASCDESHGPLTLLFDSGRHAWSDELTDACQIDASLLPPLYPCREVVGVVTAEAARATSLREGTPVLAGMVDGTAAGIEAGVIEPGAAVEMTGQSTVLMISSDAPYLGRDLFMLGHAVADRWLVVGAMVATGGSLRWFRDQLGEMERVRAASLNVDAFQLLTEQAAASPHGANRLIFLPYMYGERSPLWDSNARGLFFGLSLATTRGDMVRAVLEGAAYGLRHNLEVAEAAGFPAKWIASVGGGSRSTLWNQIKADVLQRPLLVPQAATGAPMGNAILAAVTAGCYPSLAEAVGAIVQRGVEVQPNPANASRYDDLYQIYRDLYPALRAHYAALAAVT